MLRFRTRADKRATDYASYRRWPAKEAPYVVDEITSTFDGRKRFVAIRLHDRGEYVIAHCRSRRAAERKCDWHYREELKNA